MKKKNVLSRIASSFGRMFKRLFVAEKMSVLEEEAIQTPLKTILKNFTRNRLGMIGLFVFVLFLLFAFGGSKLYPISLTYIELTNGDLPPGRGYLNYPKSHKR